MSDTVSKKLNKLEKAVAGISKNMATKDDLKRFATKDDLKKEISGLATKKDLQEGLDNLFKDIVQSTDSINPHYD